MSADKKNVFIVGAKCIGQYGGFETFVDRLIEQHSDDDLIQYHIITKANGDGAMDESSLPDAAEPLKNEKGAEAVFVYHNARVIKLRVPQIGSAQAIAYDLKAFRWCIAYIKEHHIKGAVIYVLACRIGPFLAGLVRKAHHLGCRVYVNPDGHEWKRSKWSTPVRCYWKMSEQLMIKSADLIICDSRYIEEYIQTEYGMYSPKTVYISYGGDTTPSKLPDDDPGYRSWLDKNTLLPGEYYLIVSRFVPENSFEVMIREFMASHSKRSLAIITTHNTGLMRELEQKLKWDSDERIRFTGTVYDQQLLKKIRENAYGYIHGHKVGGTNPSLLESMASTDLNLLIDVDFNRETGGDTALYWKSKIGDLSLLIDKTDNMSLEERSEYGRKAKARVASVYNWKNIGDEYRKLWIK